MKKLILTFILMITSTSAFADVEIYRVDGKLYKDESGYFGIESKATDLSPALLINISKKSAEGFGECADGTYLISPPQEPHEAGVGFDILQEDCLVKK